MGYSIGRKICEIRTEKKVSQEEIAAQLGISRQRFSRIENGQSEISYAMLEKAAEYLAVPVKEITVANEGMDLEVYFRDVENSAEMNKAVEKIVDILKTFHAHEKLYLRMKEKSDEI